MLSLKEGREILTHLGLTINQAKVYFALVQLGQATPAKSISKVSNIAREQVYTILPKLQRIGFIKKILSTPNLYEAIPMEDAFSILFDERTQETEQLQTKKSDFLKTINHNQIEMMLEEDTHQFIIFPKKENSIRKRREEIINAKTSIDFISSWKRFSRTTYIFGEIAKKALERNVKMRVILEKPPKHVMLPEIINDLKKYPNYQLKYIPKPPSAIIGIFDKKRVLIKTSASGDLAEASSLWTNNPSLLSIINGFFELNWATAMENSEYKIDIQQEK